MLRRRPTKLAVLRVLATALGMLAASNGMLSGCAGDADATPASDAAASSFPPSGFYEVTTRVIADDCAAQHAVPAPWRARVLTTAERGEARVNLPLASLSPSAAPGALARSDFRIEPGYTVEHRSVPIPACDGFAIDSSYTLQRATPDGFVITVAVTYGDAGSCSTSLPTRCTTEVEHAYALVESECAAECTRGQHPVSPGPVTGAVQWEVDCRCP